MPATRVADGALRFRLRLTTPRWAGALEPPARPWRRSPETAQPVATLCSTKSPGNSDMTIPGYETARGKRFVVQASREAPSKDKRQGHRPGLALADWAETGQLGYDRLRGGLRFPG